MKQQLEVSNNKFIWSNTDKLAVKDIEEFVKLYLSGQEYQRLCMYGKYYETLNPSLMARWNDKNIRKKTPNNLIPTAYYSTIVDTMSGYMFQNVQYTSDDEKYIKRLKEILEANKTNIKDMTTGIRALAFNKACEIIYTTGDGETFTDIKYTSIDPRQMILIYTDNIESELFCGIRIIKALDKDYDFYVDVIYNNEWQYYKMKEGKASQRIEPKQLYFTECPVIDYRTEILNDNSSFHVIIPYIDALDFLVTGNTNEMDRLIDALLVLGKVLKPEDKENMSEWKTLEDMKQEDRAEYLTKQTDPAFREYVSKLLIQEIHKHSHVIDWYSPDSGLTGAVSAKALITRLFDMDMYSRRLEMIFRDGAEKRIRLISELMKIKDNITATDKCKIIYNRTLPSDVTDKAALLTNVAFLSTQTKVEQCGLSWEVEEERIAEEQTANEVRMKTQIDQRTKLLYAEAAAKGNNQNVDENGNSIDQGNLDKNMNGNQMNQGG